MKGYRIGFYGQAINGAYGEYSNKKIAKSTVIKMAKGNCSTGQTIRWFVEDLDGKEIYTGSVKN